MQPKLQELDRRRNEKQLRISKNTNIILYAENRPGVTDTDYYQINTASGLYAFG